MKMRHRMFNPKVRAKARTIFCRNRDGTNIVRATEERQVGGKPVWLYNPSPEMLGLLWITTNEGRFDVATWKRAVWQQHLAGRQTWQLGAGQRELTAMNSLQCLRHEDRLTTSQQMEAGKPDLAQRKNDEVIKLATVRSFTSLTLKAKYTAISCIFSVIAEFPFRCILNLSPLISLIFKDYKEFLFKVILHHCSFPESQLTSLFESILYRFILLQGHPPLWTPK